MKTGDRVVLKKKIKLGSGEVIPRGTHGTVTAVFPGKGSVVVIFDGRRTPNTTMARKLEVITRK